MRKLLLIGAIAAILGAAPISDWFLGNTLASGVWTSQASGGTITQANGGVTLSAPAGSTHDTPTGAVSISQTIANTDFSVITKISTIPPSQGANTFYSVDLYAFQDANNSAVVEYANFAGSYACNLKKTVAGSGSTIATSARSGDTFPIWLELTRATNTWTGKFSFNGTSWTTIGSGTVSIAPIGVSLYADNYNLTAGSTLAYAPIFYFFCNAANDTCIPPVKNKGVAF